MSESYSRRAFLKKSALTLGMAAMCHLLGMGRAFAAAAPQTANTPERNMQIAYFSHTGNTALVTEQIQSLTGGDTHRIRTVEVYPAEHDPCSELAEGNCGPTTGRNWPPAWTIWSHTPLFSLDTPSGGTPCLWPAGPSLNLATSPEKPLSPSVRTAATVLPTARATSGHCARRPRFWKATTPGTPMPEGCRAMSRTGCGASA